MTVRVGLIGAGGIARKHLDVIRDLEGIEVAGITSRTLSKAEDLAREYEVAVVSKDIPSLLKEAKPDALMVLVSFDQMFTVASLAISCGLPVFLEKPAGLRPEETMALAELANKYSVRVMVGYNRRFYSVFQKGMDIIHQNGELLGVRVEGHERFWKLADVLKEPVRAQWIYANSTHTIDLLRFFGGEPLRVSALSRSRIEKNGDQFAAIVDFGSGAIGQYAAHWYSPGGWGVTLYGEGVTVEFKPLESGRWIDKEFKTHEILPEAVDVQYKPGFYGQMKALMKMVSDGDLAWPAQDLESAYRTMVLAQQISVGGRPC